jgi:ATP-dependent Lhr-like helicase
VVRRAVRHADARAGRGLAAHRGRRGHADRGATGSGKTLAAFLWSIDRLLRLPADGKLEDRTHVIYVSPLKALGNDVQKNLLAPLAELRACRGVGPSCPTCASASARATRPRASGRR